MRSAAATGSVSWRSRPAAGRSPLVKHLSLALALALLALLALGAPVASVRAEEPATADPALRQGVEALLSAADDDAVKAAVADLFELAPSPADVEALLARGRSYAAGVPTGWLERKNPCTDGVERNVLLYVPEDYTPEKRYRLVVDMHGGVSRPAMLSYAELEQMKFFWGDHAQEHGYLLAIPTGQTGAEWWTAVGARNVLDVIQDVKRDYNVDENLVVATGFSDGASGSYYLALTHPTPFAAFVPLTGDLAVTQAGGLQTHLLNLLNKPLYAVNTENDSLYPSASVQPLIEALQELDADLVWRDIPDFTHNPMYLPQERPAIWTWLQQKRRDPHPKTVRWQGTSDAPHRVHWLDVTDVRDVANDAEFPDPNPPLTRGRVLLGVSVDPAFEGPGVKIDTVSEDSPAAAAGLEEGDVIVSIDDVEIVGMRELRAALGGKSFGDAFTLRFRRGEEVQTVEGSFPEATPQPAFRRAKPWGAVWAVQAGNAFDVRVKGVAAFDLYLSTATVDLTRPVRVTVNGKVVHDALVEEQLLFLLTQAAEDRDRTMLYRARLPIRVLPAPKAD